MTTLIGNTFPLTLIRRQAEISPISGEQASEILADGYVSFWGHVNTLGAVKATLGLDLTPRTARPALGLSKNLLPTLDGQEYNEILVLSPNYVGTFRPAIGAEVPPEMISGWEWLLVKLW